MIFYIIYNINFFINSFNEIYIDIDNYIKQIFIHLLDQPANSGSESEPSLL